MGQRPAIKPGLWELQELVAAEGFEPFAAALTGLAL
jgi:hypothetical protein